MVGVETDRLVRLSAFNYLGSLSERYGDLLPFHALTRGFEFEGVRVPLLGPQGILKPRILDLPLSITTSPNSRYDDAFSDDGLLRYRYRGSDPGHRDNVGLREAFHSNAPLIYLHGVVKGKYLAAWPVFVVADDPGSLSVVVAVDDQTAISEAQHQLVEDSVSDYRRRYATAMMKVRLHQRTFRERVLQAYREQCALCRLRHAELLEAAHILPDAHPEGEPRIANGISLCTLHHAAFDRNLLGIRPDLVAEIRFDILHEIDGPMLKHGLQEMHGVRILVPSRRDLKPDQTALERRYEEFRTAA